MPAILYSLVSAIKSAFLADTQVKALVNRRVCYAASGQVPTTWMKDHSIAISPDLTNPLNYPVSILNHTAFNLTVYAYVENFGDEAALEKLLTLEEHILRVLVAGDNSDFDSFNGLMSACFWRGTQYPEAHMRNFEGLNEARIRFEYRL